VSLGPVAASTRAEILPLVIELFGARSKGRRINREPFLPRPQQDAESRRRALLS
jgi:hypothetical protein